VEHAALGSDFDGVPRPPRDLAGVEDLPRIPAELERRGWTQGDIGRVLGGTWRRVLEELDRPRRLP
jgi:membrane dipeptidase